MTYSLPQPVAEEQRPFDWRYQIMEMSQEAQRNEINTWDREKIISWLQWNDPNGIFQMQIRLLKIILF